MIKSFIKKILHIPNRPPRLTARDAREAIARQENEDEIAMVFRIHMMRRWSYTQRYRFCMSIITNDQGEIVKPEEPTHD